MASMRDIKRRKESIQSTQQITKAMKLVSTVKLQRAKGRAESSRPYFEKMASTVESILSRTEGIQHPYLMDNGSDKKALIVVTANRGLAGGYNNNVVKKIMEAGWDKDKVQIYGIGRKGIEILARRGYSILSDDSEMINEPLFSDAAEIGSKVLKAYEEGQVGEIWIAYTMFKNTVVHIPMLQKLLPITGEKEVEDAEAGVEGGTGRESGKAGETGGGKAGEAGGVSQAAEDKADNRAPMNYEPEAEESLDMIIPKYINSIIYGAFVEAVASENGARMQAMDNATSNAEEMISSLSLAYNRARQGAITQELTEIISGAEALN